MEVFQIAPAGTRTLLFLLIPMETTGSLFNIFPKILLIATIMKCRIDEQCGSPSTLTQPSSRGRGIY